MVQFDYGEDSLDPAQMEGTEKPVDFPRLLNHVRCLMAAQTREQHSLTGEEVGAILFFSLSSN